MLKLNGKRLLISGGPALACDIVNKARELGVYTIVTDWYEDSPAKKIADESYMVSTADIDEMVKLAKDKKVDGVFTSFIDSNLQNVRKICERLNFPFYATEEQLEITMDKYKFKQLCREHGVPVVKEFYINEEFNNEDLKNIEFPVILKPVDNSGSRGIVICKDEEELKKGYYKSLSFSKKKLLLIEKYMDFSKPGVNIEYVICDGEVILSAVGDLYVYKDGNPSLAPLTAAVFYPSKRLDEYIKNLDEKVRNMFKSIGLKNGVLYIQSFYDEDGFHFYEMGYRLGGGQSYNIISKINEVNHLEMLINHSLTGVMCDKNTKNKINPKFSKVGLGLFLLINPGKINKIINLEKIKNLPEVVNVMLAYHEGDEILDSAVGTTQQVFGRIHLVADDIDSLVKAVQIIQNTLVVEDSNAKNMLIKNFYPEVLFEKSISCTSGIM